MRIYPEKPRAGETVNTVFSVFLIFDSFLAVRWTDQYGTMWCRANYRQLVNWTVEILSFPLRIVQVLQTSSCFECSLTDRLPNLPFPDQPVPDRPFPDPGSPINRSLCQSPLNQSPSAKFLSDLTFYKRL